MKRQPKTIKVIRFEIADGWQDATKLPPGVEGDKSLMCWKELCRTGVYVTDGVEHHIDEAFLQNLVDTFFHRQAKGIEVPCPIGHCHDPEKRRGQVRYVELRKNDAGGVSLYGIIEFVSEEAKKNLMPTSVSIEAPETVEDGDGEQYHYALEHVAFTDYPVVSGMEGFKDVTFSVLKREMKMRRKTKKFSEDELDKKDEELSEDEEKEDREMGRRKRMGKKTKKFADDDEDEEFSEDEEDEELSEDEDEEFDEDAEEEDKNFGKGKRCSRKRMGKRLAKKRMSEDEDDEEFSDDEDEEFSDEDDDEEFSDDEDDEEFGKGKRCSKRMGKRFSRVGIGFSLLKENRMMKIDAMRVDGRITPAQARFMRQMYCSDRAVRFSLDTNSNREFDNACKLLRLGIGVEYGEQTPMQFSMYRKDSEDDVLSEAVDKINRKGGSK